MGVLARVFEAHGLSTTSVSLVREHTEKVKPPRALFVPFPFGYPLGRPNEPALQRRVLEALFGLLERPAGPVLEDFSEDPFTGEDVNLPQAASVASAPTEADPAFELTGLRPYYEQWLAAHAGRTAVGLSGVDQRRFRALVRCLETYARDGVAAKPREAPASEASVWQFMRWAADDLKAFYFEARLAQRPNDSFQQVNAWLWGETALGRLLREVRDRLQASGEAPQATAAFGIAR